MQEIDKPRPGAFVGRYRPKWERAWEPGYEPEFGLLVEADGESRYKIAGEGLVKCRKGTLLVRLYWDHESRLSRLHTRFTVTGGYPFVYPRWTPLSRAVERSVWQG